MANPRANHAKVIAVSSKDNFRRPVPKTYSYRYEVAGDAGPAGEPLIARGAAIIESRYRGRGVSWQISRSPVSSETYTVNGSYIHPLPENPMAYPPRTYAVPPPPAPVVERKHAPKGHATIEHHPRVASVPPAQAPAPAPATARPAAQAPATSRRERPTPANEPAYRKTG